MQETTKESFSTNAVSSKPDTSKLSRIKSLAKEPAIQVAAISGAAAFLTTLIQEETSFSKMEKAALNTVVVAFLGGSAVQLLKNNTSTEKGE